MKSLFLAWQDVGKSRAWFPIGRLDADIEHSSYHFGYTHGAERAVQEAGFTPLLSFPEFNHSYESSELFPLFRNRVVGSDREDFRDYLQQLGLSEGADPITILEVSGGRRQTDSLEVFPKLERRADGTFICRFFIHGSRHIHPIAHERIDMLKNDEPLRVSIELNNPTSELALQLESEDYAMLGWTPRYLVKDLLQVIIGSPTQVSARVVRVNPAPAPSNQRVLVELKGALPSDYEPMSGSDFQLLR